VYLFGQGVPQSLPTALHWLARAAQEGSQEACMLIGTHVPFEVARPAAQALIPYYVQAFDAGLAQAGLVLAQLVLGHPGSCDTCGPRRAGDWKRRRRPACPMPAGCCPCRTARLRRWSCMRPSPPATPT
jgi:hypothetical protein